VTKLRRAFLTVMIAQEKQLLRFSEVYPNFVVLLLGHVIIAERHKKLSDCRTLIVRHTAL
jgi:hypothetical protein